MLEMRTESIMIEQTIGASAKEVGLRAEARAWARLFSKKYMNRTLIGVMMMFFQRELPNNTLVVGCY